MGDATDYATVSPIDPRDPRHQAVELYQTTDLGVADIATHIGVSKETIYRWLRKEGIAVGRTAGSVLAGQAEEQMRALCDEIKELQREVATLTGQIRRLEGLTEALLGLKNRAV
jgi:transposase-like protein